MTIQSEALLLAQEIHAESYSPLRPRRRPNLSPQPAAHGRQLSTVRGWILGVVLVGVASSIWILTLRRSDRIEQWIAAREYPDLTELLLKGSFRVGFPLLIGVGLYLIIGSPGANWRTPLPEQLSVVLALLGFSLLFFSRHIQAYGVRRSRREWYLFDSERRFIASVFYLWLLRVVGLVLGSVGVLALLLGKTR